MTPTQRRTRPTGLAPVIALRPRAAAEADDGRVVPARRGADLHEDLIRLHEMERIAASLADPASRARLMAVVDETFGRVLDAAFPGPAGRQGRADAAPRRAARPRALRGS